MGSATAEALLAGMHEAHSGWPGYLLPLVVSSVYPVIPCLVSLLGGAAGWKGSAEEWQALEGSVAGSRTIQA